MSQPDCIFHPVSGLRLETPQAPLGFRVPGHSQPWLFNPWVFASGGATAHPRYFGDIKTDPYGLGIWETSWGPVRGATPAVSAVLETAQAKGVMSYAEFGLLVDETVETIRKLQRVKGAEYTGNETNRLAQFTTDGQDAGVTPLQCLLIYMSKHFGAFKTFVRDDAVGKTRDRSEPIGGRLDDIIVYCILAKAIIRANSR